MGLFIPLRMQHSLCSESITPAADVHGTENREGGEPLSGRRSLRVRVTRGEENVIVPLLNPSPHSRKSVSQRSWEVAQVSGYFTSFYIKIKITFRVKLLILVLFSREADANYQKCCCSVCWGFRLCFCKQKANARK
ncbi:hypothetical protein AGOR_G00074090 [Albula goreensis]|uniref:Uncharacterized protein n=1 Tax=Albula goreensis TaxID=1534307 RepID=A0A8T3DN02_9TELE|nr:hypothetical protein AGOR_G00074090 [Albula goreensis]